MDLTCATGAMRQTAWRAVPRPVRLVVPAFRHVLISSCLETNRRQIVASVTVPIFGEPLRLSSICDRKVPQGDASEAGQVT